MTIEERPDAKLKPTLRSYWGEGGSKPLASEYTEFLPSRGALYRNADGEPLLPEGEIVLRPLTTREEGILYAQSDPVEKIHRMISACVVSKFPPEELLVVDQYFILLSLRVHSFGTAYKIPVRCQFCREQAKIDIDIAEDLAMLPGLEPGVQEPFTAKLPASGIEVGFRLLRVKDEFKIRKAAKRYRMTSADPADPSHEQRLAICIQTIDGQPVDERAAFDFVRKMSWGDSNFFQNRINDCEGGVDTRIYPVCPSCGATNEMRMPLELEFFRPGGI